MKKLLALDVAFANIGWAVIEPYTDGQVFVSIGTIQNKATTKKRKKHLRASDDKIDRIQKVSRELYQVIADNDVSAVVAEIPGGGGQGANSLVGMALGTAIVALAVDGLQLPAEWTTEDEGKLAMCGDRKASKIEMQHTCLKKFPELLTMVPRSKSVKSLSGYEGWFEHAADAIAAYLAAQHGTLVRLLAQANGQVQTEPFLF